MKDLLNELFSYLQQHVFVSALLTLLLWRLASSLVRSFRKGSEIPTFYLSEGTFNRLLDPFRLLLRAKEALFKGYRKFPTSFFRLPLLNYPSGVIVVDRAHLKELYDAPNSSLTFFEAALEDLDFVNTFSGNAYNLYHVPVIRNQLTRGIASHLPALVEEIRSAFEDDIDPLLKKGNNHDNAEEEWTPIPVYEMSKPLVGRISYRAFIGDSVCGNPEFVQAVVQHAVGVAQFGQLLSYFPHFIRPLITMCFWSLRNSERVCHKYLAPIIEEHKNQMSENVGGKQGNLIDWLLEAAEGEEKETHNLVSRLLMVNFAAIHTTSMSFTHLIYDLAGHPEYVEPLREEIETLLNEHGWQKSTLMKMKKLDSFIKECLRLRMVAGVSTFRKAMKPFTFSNGITISAGETVGSPAGAIHMDDSIYENAKEFDAFRFSRMKESPKMYSVNTGTEFLTFGHGEHACPGRFFVISELKAMLALVLLKYDIRLEDGKRPENVVFGIHSLPNMQANVLFKLRS